MQRFVKRFERFTREREEGWRSGRRRRKKGKVGRPLKLSKTSDMTLIQGKLLSGMSKTDLARELGVTRQSLYEYLREEKKGLGKGGIAMATTHDLNSTRVCIKVYSAREDADKARLALLDAGVRFVWSDEDRNDLADGWGVWVRQEDARGAYVRLKGIVL